MSNRFCITRPLTPRQKQALILYAKGLSSIRAGNCMRCSPKTFDSLKLIGMKKVGARKLFDVISWAIREEHLTIETVKKGVVG